MKDTIHSAPKLAERAQHRTSEPALIQNGNSNDIFASKAIQGGKIKK